MVDQDKEKGDREREEMMEKIKLSYTILCTFSPKNVLLYGIIMHMYMQFLSDIYMYVY